MLHAVTPRHSKASYFALKGLFVGLADFAGLESRIAALPEKERGNAFEVFAEAYLVTQRQFQATEVWPEKHTPESVRRQLCLTSGDMGIDGVYQDTAGTLNAYQVKFRTGRPSLSWRELSTFFGLSDSANLRVLITNCNDVTEVASNRVSFFCVRGSDLDRLERGDFEEMSLWLQGAPIVRKPKTPWPHQERAISAIAASLQIHDRVTAVMACGTGKTLVALWLAERTGCKKVIVLVPSLALMRQTLHEWLRETSWHRLSYRCVCSDPQVSRGADEIVCLQSDPDFPVNTNSEEVAKYLAQPFDGVRVIFSTYQSASVVANALHGHGRFDLGICDEAHKTTGREGTLFSFALQDRNLPIKKRVFLTATPRHYDVSRRDKEGDAKLVYSMDVPESYGPVAHELSFVEASRLGIICNYKVVISVVTTAMVTDAAIRRGEVVVRGDNVKARQVANQIALERAVSEHGINRIFTFHSNVESAQSFVAIGGKGMGAYLPDFNTYHINGKMRTADREAILRQFAAAQRGLVSNARCLTEGVDVPAVDMVAFMSPKKSQVDIVQATGRAMRKDPANLAKTTGYILVPLFLEIAVDESIEAALVRTGFEDIWNILEALQEQDESIAEIIRQMREDKGRTGGFDDARFREKAEVLGPILSIGQLRFAIASQCIERLASMWDERYGELRHFNEEYGHCNVPHDSPEYSQLAIWAYSQRTKKKQGKLSRERIARLDALGWVWDPYDAAWEEMFEALQDYISKHGHCNVPTAWPDNPQLANWVHQGQRSRKKHGKLSPERIARLDALGFVWNLKDATWDEMLVALQDYKSKHGHCNVSFSWPENPALGSWVRTQRWEKKQGRVSPQRIARLEALGFAWTQSSTVLSSPDQRAAASERMIAALQDFKSKHGHCNVPRTWTVNPELANWLQRQRRANMKGKLSMERIEQLQALGFTWNPNTAAWEEKFAALVDYKSKHFDCNVSYGWPDNPALANWVRNQRAARKQERLSPERIARLEVLGFAWNQSNTAQRISAHRAPAWDRMIAALREFKSKHGHCNVPRPWPEMPQLANWVTHLRSANRLGTLSSARREQLESLGFTWNTLIASWDRMFAAIQDFKSKHGHCNVPRDWSVKPQLANWVRNQRRARKLERLSPERIDRVEALGFIWTE